MTSRKRGSHLWPATIGLIWTLPLIWPAAGAQGQTLHIQEAESARVTCAAGHDPGETFWARGGRLTPPFWGREAGDAIEWYVDLPKAFKDLKLAVRYSYAAEHYRHFSGAENAKRTLHLIVDQQDKTPIAVAVPDTGWWEIFQTSSVDLPEFAAGRHTFKLLSPEPHMTTNVDCLIFYRGGPERIPPNLRSTIRAACTPASAPTDAPAPPPHFVIRVTPEASLHMTPDKICREFERIYDYYEDFMGWAPPTPVGINIIEDGKWPDPGATAFQNRYGVFFRAGVMHTEQGNWCHEMTHMFYVAHFPPWFDESSVRTLTIFNFVPALFAGNKRPQQDPLYRQCEAEGRRFLDSGETTGDINLIQYAVRVKYGPEVFKRFFHACVEAGRKKELDFTPGRHLIKAEIVKYMSKAAGEDVQPLYGRWTGFSDVP